PRPRAPPPAPLPRARRASPPPAPGPAGPAPPPARRPGPPREPAGALRATRVGGSQRLASLRALRRSFPLPSPPLPPVHRRGGRREGARPPGDLPRILRRSGRGIRVKPAGRVGGRPGGRTGPPPAPDTRAGGPRFARIPRIIRKVPQDNTFLAERPRPFPE